MRRFSISMAALVFLLAGAARGQDEGTLILFVIHGVTSDVVHDASVVVTPGKVTAKTNLDGMVELCLPPGTYRLRLAKPGFLDKVVEGVEIEAGGAKDEMVTLNPKGMEVELQDSTIEVVADLEKASNQALLTERRSASVLSEGIGRQEMSRTAGSEASDVMQRLTGASVVDDKFVFIRGLGERYSATELNGARIPSTQPDKKVIAMDLFPASLLENIQTEKSYRPDKPAEFAGGLVKVNTVDFPTSPVFKLTYGTGGDTNTTFDAFQDYPGGDYEFFGFDDGTRDLPGIIPSDKLVRETPFTEGFSPEELQRFGRAFSNVWEFNADGDAPLNQKFHFIAGNTFGRLGVVAALSHSTDWHSRTELNRLITVGAEEDLAIFNDYEFSLGTQSAATSATANIAYRLAAGQDIFFRNFFTHDSSDEARTFEGFNSDFGSDLRNFRLRFNEEQIYSGQVEGRHSLGLFGNSLVEWRVTRARSSFQEPDLREVLYEFDRNQGVFILADESQSGFRQFNQLGEVLWEPEVSFTTFFFNDAGLTGSVKFGALYRKRERDFSSRRFRFFPRDTSGIDLTAGPEEVFAAENIAPDGFELRETTRRTDSYAGLQFNRSIYGMLDIAFGRWRFIGGARVEGDDQRVITADLFVPDAPPVESRNANTDVLPSVNVIYKLADDMNLRGAFSKTLNRPQFRELTPFEFTDVIGGRSTRGNPELRRARIFNYDVRWEWFPGPRDLISASFFYKDFDEPIERVVIATALLNTSWQNAESARNFGFELDYRRNLGFLSPALDRFSVTGNYTFVDSSVDLSQTGDAVVITSAERPLVGTSENIFNAIVEYAAPARGTVARMLWNFQGDRITDVGALGIPDIVENGRHRLDALFIQPLGASRKWELKLSAENLLDSDVEFTQGDLIQRAFSLGRKFSVSISYSFFGEN